MSRKTTTICDVCSVEKDPKEMKGFHINRKGTPRNRYDYSSNTKNDFSFDVCGECEEKFKKTLGGLIPSMKDKFEILFPKPKEPKAPARKRKTATRRRRRY